jgi:hypothetical protein
MLKNLINKFLGLIVIIKYGNLPIDIRYYYRHTLYCQLIQLKYFFRDYIIKKPYKVIEFNGEFAPELQFALPFAYWHFKNGTLKSTKSSKHTNELYFFSPDHIEEFDTRTNDGNYNYEIPRILYSQNYDIHKWEPVPLKAMYANNIYVYNKPILIIANRYNMEWDGPPISFYSKEMLSYIIVEFLDKYTIIYNRPRPVNITMDNSDIYDLDEYDWLKSSYPEVILMEDLFEQNSGNAKNFNHLQLMVYSNAERFISIHGGTATLASYFGGLNLIYSKKGPEHHFKCYQNLYPKFSGSKILHAKNEAEVKSLLLQNF